MFAPLARGLAGGVKREAEKDKSMHVGQRFERLHVLGNELDSKTIAKQAIARRRLTGKLVDCGVADYQADFVLPRSQK